MKRVKLNILGISSGHTASSYTLILDEESGNRKLPVVIGAAEAQSIAVVIENIKPVRPLTHDLLFNVLSEFKLKVIEVLISKLEEGIFYSNLVVSDGENITEIDSRTSDAIAIAIRYKCPIFTSESILNEAGILLSEEEAKEISMSQDEQGELEFDDDEIDELIGSLDDDSSDEDLSSLTLEELESMIQESLEDENYDLAAKIRDEISRRKSK